MLYISRSLGQSIVINDNVHVTVVGIEGGRVKLGFSFPQDTTIHRKEVFERIQQENETAVNAIDFLRATENDR